MRRPGAVAALLVAAAACGAARAEESFADRLRASIEHNLGKPYVWGSAGLKSFDCSGFVWRVAQESGVLFKRTTARKLYMSLPKVPQGDERTFATVVFFDHLKHCGIMNDGKTFYHAATTDGTRMAPMNGFWSRKVCGYRRLPAPKSEPGP